MAGYNRNTESWCICCNREKEKKNFMVSLNPDHNVYLPFCKTCINKKLKKYKEATDSDGAALYCLCAELGYPMIREYYEILLKIVAEKDNLRNTNWFVLYHNILRDSGFVVKGFWQTDINIEEFIDFGKKKTVNIDYKELSRVWGNFEPEDYELLESFYEMYTKDILEMDTAMELRYRDLCKAELRKRKADENGDIGEITKAEDSLRKNMALLKLDSFNSNKQSEIEKFIERKSWMIENVKPSECEDLQKYKDYSNFGIEWGDIMRCMRNLCGGTREYPNIPKDES